MVKQLNDILIELKTISSLLRGHQTGGVTTLPEREPSEQDTLFASRLASYEHTPEEAFATSAHTEQPSPPPLPSTVRVRWTAEMKELLVEAAHAPTGTYKNSVKYITDKLHIPVPSIRNMCSKFGYAIHNKHIVIKEA